MSVKRVTDVITFNICPWAHVPCLSDVQWILPSDYQSECRTRVWDSERAFVVRTPPQHGHVIGKMFEAWEANCHAAYKGELIAGPKSQCEVRFNVHFRNIWQLSKKMNMTFRCLDQVLLFINEVSKWLYWNKSVIVRNSIMTVHRSRKENDFYLWPSIQYFIIFILY